MMNAVLESVRYLYIYTLSLLEVAYGSFMTNFLTPQFRSK
jgi:hypothetical protein